MSIHDALVHELNFDVLVKAAKDMTYATQDISHHCFVFCGVIVACQTYDDAELRSDSHVITRHPNDNPMTHHRFIQDVTGFHSDT